MPDVFDFLGYWSIRINGRSQRPARHYGRNRLAIGEGSKHLPKVLDESSNEARPLNRTTEDGFGIMIERPPLSFASFLQLLL